MPESDANGAPPPAHPPSGPVLRERELVALQLCARGHSLALLDILLAPERAAVLLAGAARALGVATPAAAVAEARRRGLIV